MQIDAGSQGLQGAGVQGCPFLGEFSQKSMGSIGLDGVRFHLPGNPICFSQRPPMVMLIHWVDRWRWDPRVALAGMALEKLLKLQRLALSHPVGRSALLPFFGGG